MTIEVADDKPENWVKLNNALYLVRTQAGYKKARRDYQANNPAYGGSATFTGESEFAYPAIAIMGIINVELVPLNKWADYWAEMAIKIMANDDIAAGIIREKLKGY